MSLSLYWRLAVLAQWHCLAVCRWIDLIHFLLAYLMQWQLATVNKYRAADYILTSLLL